jgi:hypothetical protein
MSNNPLFATDTNVPGMHTLHSDSSLLQPLQEHVCLFLRSSVNLHLCLGEDPVNTQHPALGYKNSVECLNTSVLEESAGWLLSTRTQPISKLRLVTVVTEF